MNNSVNIPRLDREIDRSLSRLDSVIDECLGDRNPFEAAVEMSREYLEDLQDGEQDKSAEHYQAMNASQFSLESTDEMTKGDLTDQMQRQEVELEQKGKQKKAFLNREYYIRRGDKQLGPVSGVQIVKNFQDGKVLVTDEVSPDPSGPWVVISDSDMLT
jgi:hypothetical protein